MQLPGVEEQMLCAEYWLSGEVDCDELLLTRSEIDHLHRLWSHTVPSLADWQTVCAQSVDVSQVAAWLAQDVQSAMRLCDRGPLYDASGQAVSADDWQQLQDLATGALEDRTQWSTPLYGFTIHRAELRTLPSSRGVYYAGDAPRYDRLQETALSVWTPLVLLARTRDQAFYYVQAPNYRGFVEASSVAISAYSDWLQWRERMQPARAQMLVTLDLHTIVQTPQRAQRIGFAARLPLATAQDDNRWAVEMPQRDAAGHLSTAAGVLVGGGAVSRGSLPCTRRNLVTQAFALLGEPYGWGDEQNRHDCSSLLLAVCTTVGLDLPRNAGAQEALGGLRAWRLTDGEDPQSRAELYAQWRPGDLLYMPGHAMMYLGARAGRHYILHDFSGFSSRASDGQLTHTSVHQVTVSPLDLLLSSGKTYGDALTTALRLQVCPQ